VAMQESLNCVMRQLLTWVKLFASPRRPSNGHTAA
jgi:hypothetical protein